MTDIVIAGAMRTAIGSFQGQFDGEPQWQVFSPFALAQAPGFMDVAA